MKGSILVICLFISMMFCSCAPRELTKDEGEKVYIHKVQMSKVDLRTKILVFVNEGFKSSKSVIQTNEDGLITGNYDTFLTYADPLQTISYSCTMTFMIKYSDNEMKLKLSVKDIYSNPHTSVSQDYWGRYAQEIKKQFDSFDLSLVDYMNKKDTF